MGILYYYPVLPSILRPGLFCLLFITYSLSLETTINTNPTQCQKEIKQGWTLEHNTTKLLGANVELLKPLASSTKETCTEVCCNDARCNVAVFNQLDKECFIIDCQPMEKCKFTQRQNITSTIIKRANDDSAITKLSPKISNRQTTVTKGSSNSDVMTNQGSSSSDVMTNQGSSSSQTTQSADSSKNPVPSGSSGSSSSSGSSGSSQNTQSQSSASQNSASQNTQSKSSPSQNTHNPSSSGQNPSTRSSQGTKKEIISTNNIQNTQSSRSGQTFQILKRSTTKSGSTGKSTPSQDSQTAGNVNTEKPTNGENTDKTTESASGSTQAQSTGSSSSSSIKKPETANIEINDDQINEEVLKLAHHANITDIDDKNMTRANMNIILGKLMIKSGLTNFINDKEATFTISQVKGNDLKQLIEKMEKKLMPEEDGETSLDRHRPPLSSPSIEDKSATVSVAVTDLHDSTTSSPGDQEHGDDADDDDHNHNNDTISDNGFDQNPLNATNTHAATSTSSKSAITVRNATLIGTLTLGCIFTVLVFVVIGKKFFDNWQRRHYSKIDHLINGIYN